MGKILYIVLDGLGDLPSPDLGGKTSLEAALTPNMDELAKIGKTGLMYTVGKGIAPESDIAVISILGYEADKYYTGRGPLECYAAGLKVNDGDLAYRVNFATLGEDNRIVDRRVGRSLTTPEATKLCQAVNSQVKLDSCPAEFEFKNTVGHRGVLVIRSKNEKLSAAVTNTDPAYEKQGVFGVAKEEFDSVLLECKAMDNSAEAKRAAELTNEFTRKCYQVLIKDPVNKRRRGRGELAANIILSRDGGNGLPKFPSFGERYNLHFGCFVEMPVEEGIALLTGMKVIELPESTGDLAQDYILRVAKAIEELSKFDGLYIHIKGPDEPAHDGKIKEKERIIGLIDEYFFGKLLPQVDLQSTLITVTSDHATPCRVKAHSDDPVPVLVAGGSIKGDDTQTFSERACSQGELGTIIGPELMSMLAKISGSGEKSD